MMVGRLSPFLLGLKVTFQGRTVKLREGKPQIAPLSHLARYQFWYQWKETPSPKVPTAQSIVRHTSFPHVLKKRAESLLFGGIPLAKMGYDGVMFFSNPGDSSKTFGSCPVLLHPKKPSTWMPKIDIFERRYMFQTIIFGMYVKIGGCSSPNFCVRIHH